MADPVRFDERLNRRVRTGDQLSQAASTYRLAVEALRRNDFRRARLLGRFTEDEASEGRELYPVLAGRARAFLLVEGVSTERLAAEERRISDALPGPDHSGFDLERGWLAYTVMLDRFEAACEREDAPAALEWVEKARSM